MVTKHPGCQDCPACVSMQEMYGTCEYVAQTIRCTCNVIAYRKNLGKRRRSTQTFLQTETTERARFRYWMKRMREEK